jgi:hypothetical protein
MGVWARAYYGGDGGYRREKVEKSELEARAASGGLEEALA